MSLQRRSRRSNFGAGVDVRLSDGWVWTLSMPSRSDPECDALIAAVIEAEDRSEILRAELALTIYLLDKNYDLKPEQFGSLLCFPPDDPALASLQDALHGLVMTSAGGVQAPASSLGEDTSERRRSPAHARPTLADRIRAIWRFRMS
jgi:hypothetical protein